MKPPPASRPGSAFRRPDSGFKQRQDNVAPDEAGGGFVPAALRSSRMSLDGGQSLPPVRPPSSISSRRSSLGSAAVGSLPPQGSAGSSISSGQPKPKRPGQAAGPPLDGPSKAGRGSQSTETFAKEVKDSAEAKPTGRRERFTRKPSLSESLRSSAPQPSRPPPGHIANALGGDARVMARRSSMPNGTGIHSAAGKAALPPVQVPPGAGRRASVSVTTGSVTGRVRVNRFPSLAESMGKRPAPTSSVNHRSSVS